MLLKHLPDSNTQVLHLVGRVQQSFVLLQEKDYEGDFVFLCCRKGLSKGLGRRLRAGEQVAFKVLMLEEEPVGEPLEGS